MSKNKLFKFLVPIVILLCALIVVGYTNFKQSKLKLDEGFVIKKVTMEEKNMLLSYDISKKNFIKDFTCSIQELKESKVELKFLEGKDYIPLILRGEKLDINLKVYDKYAVYKDKLYEGKAIKDINNLLDKEIATTSFISGYLNKVDNISFRINEIPAKFVYYGNNIGVGNRPEFNAFLKDQNFKILNGDKFKDLNRSCPSYDIVLESKENKPSNIKIINNSTIAINVNGKTYYLESNKSFYDFVNERVPNYTLGTLKSLYEAKAVKDKDTGIDLTKKLNFLNKTITQSTEDYYIYKPKKEKYTLVYNINGKDHDLVVLENKITFDGIEYKVSNAARNYEVNFLNENNNQVKNEEEAKKQKSIQLKEGEYWFSISNLINFNITDKEDKEFIDLIFKKFETNVNGTVVGDLHKYKICRKINGNYEELLFDNNKFEKNKIALNTGDRGNKFIDKYICKNEGYKNIKDMKTQTYYTNNINSVYKELNQQDTAALVDILCNNKVSIEGNVNSERIQSIWKTTPKAVFSINNGKNNISIMVGDKETIIDSYFLMSRKVVQFMDSKDFMTFMDKLALDKNLINPTIPIYKGSDIKIEYRGKIINGSGIMLNGLIWTYNNLFKNNSNRSMDIGEEEIKVTFNYEGNKNEIRINKSGVYENNKVIYTGRYYINIIYNMLIEQLKL